MKHVKSLRKTLWCALLAQTTLTPSMHSPEKSSVRLVHHQNLTVLWHLPGSAHVHAYSCAVRHQFRILMNTAASTVHLSPFRHPTVPTISEATLGVLHHKRLGRTLRGRAHPTATRPACPAWQRVPRRAGERRDALHPRELPGGLRREQHDTDAARPRSAAALVRILQPCGRAGGGAAQSAGFPAPGKPAHALPRAAAPRAVRAARAAGCHRARGHARRRGTAGRAPAGEEREARRPCRAPRRRAPGARRDAAVRQLAGNATRAVPVERRADELLVRVETLPLPPHVARTLEHLLERAHLADEGFKLLKVSKIDMGFFQNLTF